MPTAERHACMRWLQQQLAAAALDNAEDTGRQWAFCLLNLITSDEIEQWLYPFLDDEDMWAQERAIELPGLHRWQPARQRLGRLKTTAMPNGQTAAQVALERLKGLWP